jgi:hypothetical protein
MAYFNLSGNIPVFKISLQMYVSGEIIKGALYFIILLKTSSYPYEFLVLMNLLSSIV